MCGIFGLVMQDDHGHQAALAEKALRILAREAESRGKDSSGLVFHDHRNDSYQVFKGALPLNKLLKSKQVVESIAAFHNLDRSRREYPLFVMGHSRLVTNGSQLSGDNNQPVVKSQLVGIHNGIIVNDAELWTANTGLIRQYEIDTEVLLALVRMHLESGDTFSDAVLKANSVIEGTVSTALLAPERQSLALFSNHGSLYTLTDNKGALFFASESYPLSLLERHLGLNAEQGFQLRQLPTKTGLVCRLDSFALELFGAGFESSRLADCNSLALMTEGRICVHNVNDDRTQLELVSDVAVIAKAPEAHRFEAMLEHNHERIKLLRRCTKCLLPETFPFIIYDTDGVCNYCNNYKIRNEPKPLENLFELLKPYRKSDGSPDCIVPFSGGRDSTYALHLIKKELGLNPIAFTYDWGMVTDLGRRNIARVCGKLEVENIIVAADIHWKRSNINKNLYAWLRKPHLGMIPLFMAGDKYFYYYADKVKRQTGIRLNIWGINPMENTDFKVGFLGVPPDFDKKHIYSLSVARQLKLFSGVGKAILSNPAYINSSVFDTFGSFLSRTVKPHTDYFHLFDYIRWDEQVIDKLILDEYRWEKAIDTSTTWRIGDGTAAFYNYVYFNVAGFSEHDTFRSNQIREGVISRDEGLRLINEENRARYPTIKWYLDAVNVDFQYAIERVNSIPKLYK